MNRCKCLLGLATAVLSMAVCAENGPEWDWIDGTKLPIEGKAFADSSHYYERLPACWSNKYTKSVWTLQHDCAGLVFRFVTDAEKIRVRWMLTDSSLSAPHMTATGQSGIDVYQYGPNPSREAAGGKLGWQFCVPPFASSFPRGCSNEYEVAVRPGLVTMVYLPTYNGVSEFKLGLPKGKTVKAAPPRASGITKPVVFYGTSVTQGGCTCRPSTAWPAIVGMEADVPVVNLGFSGSGRMEDVMVDVLARIDASLYVLDTVGNMDVKTIGERYERFVRRLREKRPGVPILLTVNTWCDWWHEQNDAIRQIYRKLKSSDPVLWKDLSLAGEGEAFCADRNYAVEGVHLNDWGAWNVGRGFADAVRNALSLNKKGGASVGQVDWETLDRFCKTNARELKGPVKGIVVEHPWLGQQSMDYCTKYVMDRATREGVVYLHVWAHPWSWMNNAQVKLTDRLVDVVSEHFGLGPDAKVVSYGISMGGHGALAYPQFSTKNVVAAVANCPPCDLEFHYTERPDLPRTLVAAYADEPDFAEALRRHSPLATVETFKDIPYFIYQGDADKAVNKERHGDRLVAAAAKRAKGPLKITYVIGKGCGHAQIDNPERQRLEDAVFAPFARTGASFDASADVSSRTPPTGIMNLKDASLALHPSDLTRVTLWESL